MSNDVDDKVLELGGRGYYTPADRSIANDLWIEAEARRSGLDSLHIQDEEDGRSFAARVIETAVHSGAAFSLLGGLLHPVGVPSSDWTPAVAAETAAALSKITDRDEKAAIRVVLAEALSSFFVSGLVSATTSPNSSLLRRLREGKGPSDVSDSEPTVVH